MSDPAVALAAAFVAATLGFAWLALAMKAHWTQVCAGDDGPPPGVRRLLRVFGAAGLLASLGLCIAADPVSMAVLTWMMMLAAAAALVALLLCWRPGVLQLLWPGG